MPKSLNLSITRHRVKTLVMFTIMVLHTFKTFWMKNILTIMQRLILQPLSKNEINVYELLDSFIPFLMALKLSVKSIMIYLTADQPKWPNSDGSEASANEREKIGVFSDNPPANKDELESTRNTKSGKTQDANCPNCPNCSILLKN